MERIGMCSGGYIFKSGKYNGRTLEWVFLKDPIHISRIYRSMSGRHNSNNNLQIAIANIIKRIKELDVTKNCLICGEEKAKYFLLPSAGLLNGKMICCFEDECKESLKLSRPGRLYEINNFIFLLNRLSKQEATIVLSIFKQAHKGFEEKIFN